MDLADLPVFLSLGLYGVRPGRLLEAGLFDRESLRLMGAANVRGKPCAIVVDEPQGGDSGGKTVTYYVAPDWDGAVVRLETSMHGALFEILDIDYAESAAGWYPTNWQMQSLTGNVDPAKNELRNTRTLHVQHFDTNVEFNPEDFQISLAPGMVVLRRDAGMQKLRVAEDGLTLEPLRPVAGPNDMMNFTELAWRAGMGIGVLGLIVATGVLLNHRRRKAGNDFRRSRENSYAAGWRCQREGLGCATGSASADGSLAAGNRHPWRVSIVGYRGS
jgi:hypothetical protein